MERLQRGFVFWVLLLVTLALPVSAQKTVKKQLYHANIADSGGSGVGSGQIVLSQSSPTYMVRTNALPNQAVTKVTLVRNDGTWPGEITLCENGNASSGDCTYDDTGNLDIEGAIVAPMFPAGVSGADFMNALTTGVLQVRLNGGSAGTGLFYRIM